jgi:prepilin-type N-terminal cleavage/methylation domain-containing protein
MNPTKPLRTAYPKSRVGFTLVELLIVIVIIAVLAALIMGLNRKMSEKAQKVNAMSVLKQVANANIGYSTENSGKINTVRFASPFREDKVEGDLATDNVTNYVNNSFWGRSQPYLFSGITNTQNAPQMLKEMRIALAQLFSTPDLDRMAKTILNGSLIYKDGSTLPVPFSFNLKMSPYNEWKRVTHFENPSRVIWATYGRGKFQDGDGDKYVPLPASGTTTGSAPPPRIYFFENKKSIVAFLDGHIEELSPPFGEGRYE